MTKSNTELATIPFDCSLVGNRVNIERVFTVFIGRTGEELARAVKSTRFDSMDLCPITTRHPEGSGTSFDWAKCVFLQEERI